MIPLDALFTSLSLAAVVTLCLLGVCLPLVRLRLTLRSRWAALMDIAATLPLVLPPTVAGFYFILAFSPASGLGRLLREGLGLELLFTFKGLALASAIMSFPLMYQNLKTAMEALGPSLTEASHSLGRGPLATFFGIIIPNIKEGILSGAILVFAHVLGEFGLALMVGGSLEGRTKTLSIAIWEAVETGNIGTAHLLSLVLLAIALCAASLLVIIPRPGRRRLA